MDQLGSGGLAGPGSGISYATIDSSVPHQVQRADSAAASPPQPLPASAAAMQPLAYSPQSARAPGSFVRDMGAPGAGVYTSLPSAADTSQYHIGDEMERFGGSNVATDFHTDGVDAYHAAPDTVQLGPPPSISADTGMRGGPDGHASAAHQEPPSSLGCMRSQEPHGSRGSPGHGPDDGGGSSTSSRAGRLIETPLDESATERGSEVATPGGHAPYHNVTHEQGGGGACGAPGPATDSQGFGDPRSGIEKYLQWLDAIHTACSKLDDLCSKLDRNFPNATREWDATSAGIRGARQIFQMYADVQPPQPMHHQHHAHIPGAHGSHSMQDEMYSMNPRKRPRREPSAALLPPAAMQGPQSPAGTLAHEFAGAATSMPSRNLQHMQQRPTGTISTIGIGGAFGPPVVDLQGKPVAGGSSLSMPIAQPCSPPLPGTANVLSPAGVPATASLADRGEYEYLLDYPEQEAPDPDNPSDLKCDVAGVYWDKRSWIASWYEGGKRYYKSFSAKTHGFYRSKYWAIKVRLSKVQSHALAGKNVKARGTAA